MSLTSELRNPNSAISQWFKIRESQIVLNIVSNHNNLMSGHEIIRPMEGTDFCLVGKGVTIYLQKYFAAIVNQPNWIEGTIAGESAHKLGLIELPALLAQESRSLEEEAFKCLLLAAAEDYGRAREHHTFIQPFLNGKGNIFNPDKSFFTKWRGAIADAAQIIATIPDAWETVGFKPKGELTCNATFPRSADIRGADAQIIIGNTLVDVRTTAKRRPFDLNNFYQQISYCLLDKNNRYAITQLAWYYSRQQNVFIYPITSLFKDIKTTRKEFNKMILRNYKIDEWGDDSDILDIFHGSRFYFES